MSTDNYAKAACEICGRHNLEMPTIFRGTGRCSVICQKADRPTDTPTPESEPSCAT